MLVLLGAVCGIVSAAEQPEQEKPGLVGQLKVANNRWAISQGLARLETCYTAAGHSSRVFTFLIFLFPGRQGCPGKSREVRCNRVIPSAARTALPVILSAAKDLIERRGTARVAAGMRSFAALRTTGSSLGS